MSTRYVDGARPRHAAPAQLIVDVDHQERRSQEHWDLPKLLTDHLLGLPGVDLRMPDPRVDPLFDVAWEVLGQFFIAEVKTLPSESERQQMRLGLGQILHYQQRYLDEHDLPVQPVLFVELEPGSPVWQRLCQRVGVLLCSPGTLDRLGVVI